MLRWRQLQRGDFWPSSSWICVTAIAVPEFEAAGDGRHLFAVVTIILVSRRPTTSRPFKKCQSYFPSHQSLVSYFFNLGNYWPLRLASRPFQMIDVKVVKVNLLLQLYSALSSRTNDE
jgi:hypothetical protein